VRHDRPATLELTGSPPAAANCCVAKLWRRSWNRRPASRQPMRAQHPNRLGGQRHAVPPRPPARL